MSFAVLLSVYHKENPVFLEQALNSIWDEQTLKPNQIVLVEDGPLTPDLDEVITRWKIKLGETLTSAPLHRNVGLAAALNEGLKCCKYELVARMDTDDISLPQRFEKQVRFMLENPQVDVSSGLIEEWSEDFSCKISERNLPLSHVEILKLAKSRSPISHVAVIFKKIAVLEVGGYPLIYPEDYPLWGKLLVNNKRFANLSDPLVKVRVGNALVERRGLDFLKGEIKVFQYLQEIGFITKFKLYKNILIRVGVRLSPVWIKKILYKYFR